MTREGFCAILGFVMILLPPRGWVHSHEQEAYAADTMLTPAQPAASTDSAYTIIREGYDRLKPIFRRGCFDCHSDSTEYPRYHALPIVGKWMDGHIREAHKHLDFSNGFPFGGHASQADNLYSIKEEVLSGDMPLFSYRLLHWSAAPNDAEKDSIAAWVDRGLIMLAAHGVYPFNNPENVPAK